MTTSIAIFGWLFLGLVTAVSLERPRCYDDDWWTSGNVLAGRNTPVFFLRWRENIYDPNPNFAYSLDLQENAMVNLTQQSRWFGESGVIGTDVNNECPQPEVNPRTIYTKVVVVVTYKLYERFDKNLINLLEYLMAVWNGVDLNLRSLNDPKVRLNIAGIVVADRRHGLAFITKRPNRDGKMDSNLASGYFARFLENNVAYWNDHFGSYHIAVLMTTADSFWPDDRQKAIQYSRTACEDIDSKGPPARIVFTDDGSWSRITRELTDAVARSFQIGSGRAARIDWDVVSSWNSRYNQRQPMWAASRLNNLQSSLNSATASCYNEKPVILSPLPRVLPGKIFNCNSQCKIGTGKKCCGTVTKDHCKELRCKYYALGFIPAGCQGGGMYAADGTPCVENGKVCYRRECVVENEIR